MRNTRLNTILIWGIGLGSIVLIVEITYLVHRATREVPSETAAPRGPTATSFVGVRFPDQLVPQDTRVVGVIFTHCDSGCEGNVPIWNAIAQEGVGVIALTRALAIDARLFREKTGAQFPVTAFEGDEFLKRFDGSHVGWTLVVDENRVVVHAFKGQLWDQESVLRRVPGR